MRSRSLCRRLAVLPWRDKHLLYQRLVEGRSLDEVAAAFGVSPAQIGAWQWRALRDLPEAESAAWPTLPPRG